MQSRPLSAAVVLLVLLSLTQACKPKDFDADYKEAESKVAMGDSEGALNAYRHITSRYPEDPRRPLIIFRMAELYGTVLDDADLALSSYSKLISEYPLSQESVAARERRAKLLEKKGDMDGAIADYAALLKHFPESPDHHRYRVLLAGAYLAQRNFPQARAEAWPLIEGKVIPRDMREQALFIGGESFFLDGDPEKAIPYYQQMLKEFPTSKLASEAELHMATCVEEMGYLGTARDITRDAARDYPNQKVIDTRLKSIKERGGKK